MFGIATRVVSDSILEVVEGKRGRGYKLGKD